MSRPTAPILCLLALLGGCKLIDQTTFDANAGKLATYVPPPGPAPVPPLVTVDFGHPNPDYAGGIAQAVNAALARKSDVEFDVVTVVPATGTPDDQVRAATALVPDAREIARTINRDGVDDARIHLSARADAGVATRQVQVFVR